MHLPYLILDQFPERSVICFCRPGLLITHSGTRTLKQMLHGVFLIISIAGRRSDGCVNFIKLRRLQRDQGNNFRHFLQSDICRILIFHMLVRIIVQYLA